MTMITCIDLSKPRKYVSNLINDKIFEFKIMPEDKKEKYKTIVKITETTLLITITYATPVNAAPVGDKIIRALDPLVDIIQSLGYPLAMVSMSAGAITMMFNKRLGIKIIKDTVIAFLVLQFLPGIMGILIDIGKALRG